MRPWSCLMSIFLHLQSWLGMPYIHGMWGSLEKSDQENEGSQPKPGLHNQHLVFIQCLPSKDFFNFLSFLFFFSCFASTFGAFVLLKGVDVLWAGVLQTHQFSLRHVSWWVLASKPAWFHSCKHIHHASSKWITYLPFPSSGSVPEKKLHPYKQWLHFHCPRKDLSWEYYWTKQVWYSTKKNWDEWVYKMRLEKFQKSM